MLMYKERPREMGIPSKLIRSALRARSVVSMYQSTPPSLLAGTVRGDWGLFNVDTSKTHSSGVIYCFRIEGRLQACI